jgi:hypothetical protein
MACSEGSQRGLHRGPYDIGGDCQGGAARHARVHREQANDEGGVGFDHDAQCLRGLSEEGQGKLAET